MNPHAQPGIASVRLLGPEEIAMGVAPAVERIGKYTAGRLDFELLDRYAGPEMLSTVQEVFEAGLSNPTCNEQAKMLRYFLRVVPEYGAQQVKAALGVRKDRWCYRELLQDIGDQIPQAQEVAIEALNDEVPAVQMDATLALGRWGTVAAEEALFARLEKLHQEWSGRADALREAPEVEGPGNEAMRLAQNLVSAIGTGSGWLCSAEELLRLEALSLTNEEKKQIEFMRRELDERPIAVEPMWDTQGDVTFSTRQANNMTEEQLVKRFGMYPAGTVFLWNPPGIGGPAIAAEQEAEFERMRSAAEGRGAKLEKPVSVAGALR